MNLIGTRIRKQRIRLQKTATQIADEIDVPISTYREWENGRSIRGEFYLKLSTALNISIYELLTGNKPKLSQLLPQLENLEKIISSIKVDLNSFE